MANDEVRTTSATGGQKGVKPERFSLLPRRGLEAIARVFAFGAEKYDPHNWRRGYEWSKSLDALERHFQAAKDGETYDEESGLPHLAHAGFHVLVLLTWLEEQGEGADNPMDDRWPAALERMRRETEGPPEWEAVDLRPVNRTIANMLVPGFEGAIDWQDPEPPTLYTSAVSLENLRAQFDLPYTRFVAGDEGTSDRGEDSYQRYAEDSSRRFIAGGFSTTLEPSPIEHWSLPPLDSVGDLD